MDVLTKYIARPAGSGSRSRHSIGWWSSTIRTSGLHEQSSVLAQRNAASEISVTLLWQEWQTIGKARLLFVDIVSGERAKKLIVQNRKFLQERFNLTSTAISQGNATLATLSPDLVAVGDIQKTSDDLERLQLSRRHQLNALLGLAPDAKLALLASTDAPSIDPVAIHRQRSTLADRRPDLIALQYGYRSEDAKVRQAILSQFPNLSIGLIGGSDTSNIISFGPQLTVELPIFDRNHSRMWLKATAIWGMLVNRPRATTSP